jgi:hypothetical protein
MRTTTRLSHLVADERGISTMLVGFAFVGFLGASTLALDIGMYMTSRSQAQNSADAGALAGAVALVFNDYDDRSPSGPAVTSAVSAAAANEVMRGAVDVGPADVTFPLGPTGQNNRVRVWVDRSVPTLMGWIFDMDAIDIKAAAVAEASPANAATCLLPFTIPDKWNEITAPPFDEDAAFDMYDKKGKLLNPRDVYTPGEYGTGYNAQDDKGMLLRLKADNGSKVAPSFYNPWRMPGSSGADDYREAISGCNNSLVETQSPIDPEPGNMVGPTSQGINDLMAQDPLAYWDTGCTCIKGSAFPISPRLRALPLYDPVYYAEGKHNGSNASLKVTNFLGVFVIGMQGNEVLARVHPVTGLVSGNPTTPGAFAKAIRLVE